MWFLIFADNFLNKIKNAPFKILITKLIFHKNAFKIFKKEYLYIGYVGTRYIFCT